MSATPAPVRESATTQRDRLYSQREAAELLAKRAPAEALRESLYMLPCADCSEWIGKYGRFAFEDDRHVPLCVECAAVRCGWIYFIQSGRSGPIKIGWTRSPDGRLDQLQTSHAEFLRVIGLCPGTRQNERAFHELLADYRLRGEWFQDSPAVRALLAEETVE